MAAWVSSTALMDVLGFRTKKGVLKRAKREGWRSRMAVGNGGRHVEYLVRALPIAVRELLLAAPEIESPRQPHPPGQTDTSPAEKTTPAVSLERASQTHRSIAEKRAETLLAWEAKARREATSLTAAYTRDLGVTLGTLWRWRKAYEAGGLAALLPAWRGPQRQIPEEAWQYFLGIYLDTNRPSAQEAYEILLAKWADEHGGDISALPSLTTLRRRLQREIPSAALTLYRGGRKAFRDKAEPHLTRKWDEVPAGDEIFFDHHPFDFVARLPGGKAGRLWLTAAADLRSRLTVGWSIIAKPSTDSVLSAFAHAVATYGAPLRAWMDNGSDFKSKEVSGGNGRKKGKALGWGKPRLDEGRIRPFCAELGIETHFCIPYSARSKPIEREFGTLARRFSKRWPSWVGGNSREKPETAQYYFDHPEKCPTLQEVCVEFARFVEERAKHPHRGRGMNGRSPAEAFEAERGEIRPVDEKRLSLLALRQARSQKVKRNGVSLFGGQLWYWCEDLLAHLNEQVILRYQPADLSKIWIFDPQGRLLMEVERSDLHNVSRQDVGKAMRASRRAARALRDAHRPERVDWKYAVAGKTAEPAPGATPHKGRSGFDMEKLDEELLAGLEASG